MSFYFLRISHLFRIFL